jgi:hypothetical protein
MLPPLGPGHHHADVAAAAPGADELLPRLGNGCLGPVPLGHLDRVGRPVAARLTPDNQPHMRGGCVAERHRRSRRGFHPSG